MHPELDRMLLDPDRIHARVVEVADELERATPHDRPLTLVPVLTGGLIFAADLMRCMDRPLRLHLITASSYPGTRTTPGRLRLGGGVDGDAAALAGRHVLLVDDILDSGQTLTAVRSALLRHDAASVRTCVLLRKEREAARQTPVDHVAFDIPDAFVVGYGLDFNGYYRNLPGIGVLSQAAIDRGTPPPIPAQPARHSALTSHTFDRDT